MMENGVNKVTTLQMNVARTQVQQLIDEQVEGILMALLKAPELLKSVKDKAAGMNATEAYLGTSMKREFQPTKN